MTAKPTTGVLDAMQPIPFRVLGRRRELADTFTLELEPVNGRKLHAFQPGQFNMLYHFGVGEVPISISGDPAQPEKLIHTIRNVGAVTAGLGTLAKGDTIGVRGPFGTPWPVDKAEGNDVIIVAGGIGLAPLRPAIEHVLANRKRYGRFVVLYGARTPKDILYLKQLQKWRGRLDTYVDVTVDRAMRDWAGNVGPVTRLLPRINIDPYHAIAMVCGPEIMMRFTVTALNELGVKDESIYVSMERNMKCALGHCGHCQMGSHFVCKDGPVFAFADIRDHFRIRGI
ncbi:FAD/NAD(P)-binding protein [Pseudomonadota bacterium]